MPEGIVSGNTAPGWRSWAFAGLLLGAALGMSAFLRPSPPPRVPPLEEFPMSLGSWQGSATPLPPATLEALDLHDYLNRVYFGQDQEVVGLYIAYYPQQTFGDDIHSPKNCLPGSGWEPLQSGSMSLAGAWPGRTEPMTVNSYLVARGNQRELILYWYQQQGRAIRSEYWSKFYQVWDGLRRRRAGPPSSASSCRGCRSSFPIEVPAVQESRRRHEVPWVCVDAHRRRPGPVERRVRA